MIIVICMPLGNMFYTTVNLVWIFPSTPVGYHKVVGWGRENIFEGFLAMPTFVSVFTYIFLMGYHKGLIIMKAFCEDRIIILIGL